MLAFSSQSLQSVLDPHSSIALLTKYFALTSFDYLVLTTQCFSDHPFSPLLAPLACSSVDPPH